MAWVAIEDVPVVAEGEKQSFRCEGLDILMCRVEGRLYAVEDLCSHARSPLSRGILRGHTIVCPLHGARFDVRDGSHLAAPASTGIACYTVEERDGSIRIDLPEVTSPPPSPFGSPITR